MKMLRQSALYAFLLLMAACKQSKLPFVLITADHSNITFNNQIVETDSMNPIDVTNIYNGGGVGVGDFNNDGLEDIYFTGNMVPNRLYLNKGDLKFQDVTQQSHVDGKGRWCKGVSVIDINNDGQLDLYVCASMNDDPGKRKNLLYINQGTDNNGIPAFQEMAHEYGLDDTTHSTMASFFDYDNDGDLDVYIVVNQILKNLNPSILRPKITDGTFPSTGRLYQNNMDSILKHPVFKDVTRQAGLTLEGYGHGVNIVDINNDGWKDIYVTNDFIANDILYVNNRNGTFTDKAAAYFKHTSANGMGQDIVDINNDGLADVIELDMDPEDNYRKKMMLSPVSYQTYRLSDFYGYQYQYVRNTLQLNLGPRNNAGDSTNDPVFADVGFYAGIAETDWSWSPLAADFDNDGLRDLIVTNGFPRDITDHDFIAFRMESSAITPLKQTLAQIPQVKLHSYAFKNQGNCRFDNVSQSWGFNHPAFSNGAAYADLDNDGDLDIIMNNINDPASIYENKQGDKGKKDAHYLSLKLKGNPLNINGLGAIIKLFYDSTIQLYEQTPYRGYLSSMPLTPHFGLGKRTVIDSLVVTWQHGEQEVLKNITADQTIILEEKNARLPAVSNNSKTGQQSWFTDMTDSLKVDYTHFQEDFTDFSIQKLLPHKFSEYGPGLASGDINNDGLDDIIIPGNSSMETTALIQDRKGNFTKKIIAGKRSTSSQTFQSMGATLFDADSDGDMDLYITHGGYESGPNTAVYNDEFFLNDGKGNFALDSLAFPGNVTSKSCVRTVDFDRDGDMDVFIAGRVLPWNYPKAVSCFLYRNDSHNGVIKFTDVTNTIAPELQQIGLICDATFTDLDNDNWPDLVLAGEWMPLTIFKNEKGSFKNVTGASGLAKQSGWWNSILAGDFDNDGDMDLVAGNLGENSFFKASDEYPISIYAKDFDNNQSYDAIVSMYLPVSQDSTNKKEFPVHLRDDMIKQMISTRSFFQNYKSYARATMSQLLNAQQLSGAQVMHANNLKSCYCRNDGNGKFSLVPLPFIAQLSTLNGMVCDDFDKDGNLDIAINTNDFGTELSVGRYDALNGLILKGNGKGNFTALSIAESGMFIEGNGKALVKLRSAKGGYLLAATQNRNRLRLFRLNKTERTIALKEGDVCAEIHYSDGRKQKQTFYSASGFLSESSHFISVSPLATSIEITDHKGQKRNLQL